MKRNVLTLCACAAVIAGCGPALKTTGPSSYPAPTQEQADSLIRTLVRPEAAVQTFRLETPAGPKAVGFVPAEDLGSVQVLTLAPQKGAWQVESTVDYPANGEEGLAFRAFTDSSAVRRFGTEDFITFATWSASEARAQHAIFVYSPAQGTLQQLSFAGKLLADGRIEGSSDKDFLLNAARPEMQWAIAQQASDSRLVALSEADILTDQAIAWWLDKNPAALTRATRITAGTIPAESSLVARYKAAAKETASPYSAALFDLRGYTVIVSYNRTRGEYTLNWAEPQARNKRTDRLLNSIYFENGSTLALFYYQGNKTFKYHLTLANGTLRR